MVLELSFSKRQGVVCDRNNQVRAIHVNRHLTSHACAPTKSNRNMFCSFFEIFFSAKGVTLSFRKRVAWPSLSLFSGFFFFHFFSSCCFVALFAKDPVNRSFYSLIDGVSVVGVPCIRNYLIRCVDRIS